MSTTIQLLGRPQIRRDGVVVAVRGRKSWALLALLVAHSEPVSRQRLAAMLFDAADDPLGALRWSLAQLRRSLDDAVDLAGDPVAVRFSPDTTVDVDVLERGTWVEATQLLGLGDELLAGFGAGTEAFDAWLTVERARATTLTVGHLNEAAMNQLTAGQFLAAAEVAGRLVEVQPLDENHHQLLVRALALSGQGRAAHMHVAAATDLLTRELGIAPGPGLAASATVEVGSTRVAPAHGRASVLTQLEAGEAAVAAGATEAGIDCLRRAVHEAATLAEPRLEVRTLTSLGSALIHGVRGFDTEGAVTMHSAIRRAEDAGIEADGAAAHRELGWVAVQHGRHDQAMTWLDRSAVLANDDAERARILGVRGLAHDDAGCHAAAIESFDQSARLARAASQRRQLAWTLSMRARTHMQMAEHQTATALVDEALEIIRSESWNAFLPCPETQQAQLQLAAGARRDAVEGFEHAFALACHIGDPCWEALAERGLASVDAELGDVPTAVGRLHDARQRCLRHPDTYRWVTAQVLDTLCAIGVAHGLPSTDDWIGQLESVAANAGLRDLVVQAHLYRADLGHPGAHTAAALLADGLDNRALLARLSL